MNSNLSKKKKKKVTPALSPCHGSQGRGEVGSRAAGTLLQPGPSSCHRHLQGVRTKTTWKGPAHPQPQSPCPGTTPTESGSGRSDRTRP